MSKKTGFQVNLRPSFILPPHLQVPLQPRLRMLSLEITSLTQTQKADKAAEFEQVLLLTWFSL